jgi:RNA polymerase sigma factor (sigma-70 family)
VSNEQTSSNAPLIVFERVAANLLARHSWRLLDKTTLAAQALLLTQSERAPTAEHANRVCQQVYAHTLYAALQDPARRELAYGELHIYLHRIAQRQFPDGADDIVQDAMRWLCEHQHTCREPGSFLKFAMLQLNNPFRRYTSSGRELSLEAWLEGGETTAEHLPTSLVAPDLEAEVLARAQAADFLGWMRRVIEENPRARDQFRVVAMKYLDEDTVEEIAATLQTSVNNVYVLLSRGLAKLRQEYQKYLSEVQDS